MIKLYIVLIGHPVQTLIIIIITVIIIFIFIVISIIIHVAPSHEHANFVKIVDQRCHVLTMSSKLKTLDVFI